MTKKKSVRIPAFLFLLLRRYTKEGEKEHQKTFLSEFSIHCIYARPTTALAAFLASRVTPFHSIHASFTRCFKCDNHNEKESKITNLPKWFSIEEICRDQYKSGFSCCHWRKIMSGSSRYKWMSQKSLNKQSVSHSTCQDYKCTLPMKSME